MRCSPPPLPAAPPDTPATIGPEAALKQHAAPKPRHARVAPRVAAIGSENQEYALFSYLIRSCCISFRSSNRRPIEIALAQPNYGRSVNCWRGPSQADRCLGQSNAEKRLFGRQGFSPFRRSNNTACGFTRYRVSVPCRDRPFDACRDGHDHQCTQCRAARSTPGRPTHRQERVLYATAHTTARRCRPSAAAAWRAHGRPLPPVRHQGQRGVGAGAAAVRYKPDASGG